METAKARPEIRIPESDRESPRMPKERPPRIAASTVNAPQRKANLIVDFT
jgi:hypothetical protein